MTLSNANGTQLSTFMIENYHKIYHLTQLVNHMDAPFYGTTIYVNTRDIIKCWVKESSNFRSTPTHV